MDSSSTMAAPASSTSISQLDTLSRELTATGIHCATDTGYYYLAEDWKELKDGHVGMALLYVDYASRQEVYLCSDSGCSHDTDRCSAIFSDAEFILGSSALFVYQDKLYLLSKESDNDNSYSTQRHREAPEHGVQHPADQRRHSGLSCRPSSGCPVPDEPGRHQSGEGVRL